MRQVESERKFDIGEDDPLPALGGLLGVGQAREHRLRAVYLDTRDLLLVRHRITLRRREGGADEGWHLKLPRPDGTRLEVHAPLDAGPGRFLVPATLREEIAGVLGEEWPGGVDGVLLPAATLSTHRLEVDLLDPQGRVLAQLCDDTVTALPAGSTWRELEVELVEGEEELLDRVVDVLAEQGVTVADAPSKLARALGDRPRRVAEGEAASRTGPAADVLHDYLARQVAVILGREADVRADAPDAVHKTRVATRRLRSALRTFRRLLDREVTDPLREEIRWFAAALGEPRDAEVMKERLLAALDDLPADQLVGPVRERVGRELDRRHAAAHAALVQVLDSDRHRALVDGLLELLAVTPWRGRARKSAVKVLPPLVARAADRAELEWAAATEVEGEERLHLLHETRKRAKAVRYACEALAPSFGEGAARQAEAWESVTETLGGLQDSAVGTRWLRELERAADEAGEPTFTYGVLVGGERARACEDEQGGLSLVEQALESTTR
ncbi:CYTH and CHAD domain-containing protein [Ornithinimicrobium cerasi]|uniref:CHAD domain-containing protein n=1 Tax=Ornithinimicrobium cerasi TaxID=2248773 RepID=A0A285VX98_9MICO|nr:CYTH and CHAD domain-containing protein [Ornithinimicrobium cerasi]SOC57291.1 CHAD domain-containing protein [Ornithinimicrobium cerasi]